MEIDCFSLFGYIRVMTTFTATEAKNRFGEVLEIAQAEPVRIQQNGLEVAIIVSSKKYQGEEKKIKGKDMSWLHETLKKAKKDAPAVTEQDYWDHLDEKYGR